MLPSVVLALALTQLTPKFSLGWNVPCAPAPDVAQLLEGATGEASVVVSRANSLWQLEVTFVAPVSGVRQLEAETCEEAATAALLFLRLGATGFKAATAEPRIEKPAPSPPAVQPPEPRQIRLRLDVGAAANVGGLPSVTPRVAVTLGVGAGRLEGFLSARAGFPVVFSGGPTASSKFSVHPVIGAQLSGCFLFSLGRAHLGPCLAASFEAVRATGLEVDRPRTTFEVGVGIGADAKLLVDLTDGGLFAFAAAGVRLGLRRPVIAFDGVPAFIPPLASGEGGLGLGWRW